MIVKEFDRADDLTRGAFALHPGRRKQNMNTTRPSRDYIDDVSYGGAGRRRYDADASGEEWNRALQFSREQTFSLQTCFRLFECELQRAGADRLERFDNHLILALGLVHADAAPHTHLQAVFGTKTYALVRAAIARRAHLCELIFQSEVPVPGIGRVEIRDLALNPDGGETLFQLAADRCGQLRHRHRPAFSFVKQRCEQRLRHSEIKVTEAGSPAQC